MGSPEKSYAAWSYSRNNIHLSSKAFVELARLLFEQVLKNAQVGSFELMQKK